MIVLLFTFFSICFAQDCVDNPLAKLKSLKLKSTHQIKFNLNNKDYTMSPFNFFGIHNHFQGILKNGNSFYISGGNKNSNSSDLFLTSDSIFIKKFKINHNKKHWHAGSFQKLNNKLIIPIERLSSPLTSEILEFDLDTYQTKNLFNKETNKTGALDFVTIKDKKYIVLFDPEEISIYKFPEFEIIKSLNYNFFTGSAAKIIKSCDNIVFFLNLTNNGFFPPLLNGKNIIEVYTFNFDKYELSKVTELSFEVTNSNFRGAVNIQVESNKIRIFSTSMYLNSENFLFIDTFE